MSRYGEYARGLTALLLTWSGGTATLAQSGDGDVVIWGVWNCTGSELPPQAAPARPAGTRYIDVAVSYGVFGDMYAAVRSDGVAVRWGGGSYVIPEPPTGTGYTHVASAQSGFLLVRSDGSVVLVERDQNSITTPPPGEAFVDAAGGSSGHFAGLTSAGRIVCWGNNDFGQCIVPTLPSGVQYTSVCAGLRHSGGLVSDGTLRIWGNAPWPSQPPALSSGESWKSLGMRGGVTFTGTTSAGQVRFWGECASLCCGCFPGPGQALWIASVAGESMHVASRSDGYVFCQDSAGAFNLCLVPAIASGHFITALDSNRCTAAGIVVRDCNLNAIPDEQELAARGADFNRDGLLDECQCIADVVADHVVDGVDLALVLGRWGQTQIGGPGDINRDGFVDGTDMAVLLGSWGPCGN